MSKYQQLADTIRAQIRSGKLKPGQRIPSTAQLQEQFQVSYGTVRAAMLILKAERLVLGRQGEGVFVRVDSDAGNDVMPLTRTSGR